MPVYLYLCGMLIAMLPYGIHRRSVVLSAGAALVPFYIPILALLRRLRGGFTGMERVLAGLSALMAPAMIAFSRKDDLAFVFLFVGLIPFTYQPYEIWRNRSAGAVEIRLVLVGTASLAFWTAYGFATDNWVLKVVSPLGLTNNLATVALWFMYRKPRPHPTS